MDKDMHYYGTYCLARAAGLKQEAARIIAHSAQFVDDSVAKETDQHKDGSKIVSVPTAHHVVDIRNLNETAQRYIWVPFHFIPGCQGDSFTEQLVCRMDSTVAREMVYHNIEQPHPFILELVGSTAHVYMDTFAHYGFSGVSSRRNRVVNSSIETEQYESVVNAAMGKTLGQWFAKHGGQVSLLDNIRSIISFGGELGSGALGHGGVSTYPDQPYLKWSFEYEYPHLSGEDRMHHDNPTTFLEGAMRMYNIFLQFATTHPEYYSGTEMRWGQVEDSIKEILALEVGRDDRIEAWREASISGEFVEGGEEIPEYSSDEWNDAHENFSEMETSAEAFELPVYRFFQAADFHQNYVLRQLLPSHGLIVV